MKSNTTVGLIALLAAALITPVVLAESKVTVGVWANYRYVDDDNRDEETIGDIADEALIIYADGAAEPGEGNWSYSAELRLGPGSFTDTANNTSGDQIALHKAWVGFDFKQGKLLVGKSQVPFAWKTVNFWPGDGLQAGYGDQMDVGAKWLAKWRNTDYQLAYFHADDWGETSTDTVDDNGHWGSSTTYRKVQTVVGNIDVPLTSTQTLSFSGQLGRLQDLTAGDDNGDISGSHNALAIHHHGRFGAFYVKTELFAMQRDLPDAYRASAGLPETIKNTRGGFELGFQTGKWLWYADTFIARAGTSGSTEGTIYSFSPGFSYDYGPGWIYIEILSQDGFIDRNGQVNDGDFNAFYASIDFYL